MYEYKVYQVSEGEAEEVLNRLGKYGWDLVSINQQQRSVTTNYAGLKPIGVSGGGSSGYISLFLQRKTSDVTEEIRKTEIEELTILELNRQEKAEKVKEDQKAAERGCLIIPLFILVFIGALMLVWGVIEVVQFFSEN